MSQLLIQLSHIHKSYGPISIFDDLSLSIHFGEVFALIGENGSGKTTLLKLLAGSELPDTGMVNRSSQTTVGFLPQEITVTHAKISAREYIEEGPLKELERKMAACLKHPEKLDEWADLHEQYEQLGGYEQVPIEHVLNGLKVDSLLNLPMSQLSSGQRVRVALAKALIENPSLLLLDEPTNHLDSEMVGWLQEILAKRKGATVIVSHDRKFINQTCNRLVEINDGIITSYGGNYDFYLKERQRLLEAHMQAFENQEEEKKLLKQKIKAITFSKKSPRPPADRNIMAYDRRGEHHQKSLQRNLSDLKARLEDLEANQLQHPKPKTIKGLLYHSSELSSRVAVEVDHATVSFGEKAVFTDLNCIVNQGDRIIIAGPNGAGKTTLLRCIAGLIPLKSGRIRLASTAKIGYLDQEVELLPMKKNPFTYFGERFQLTEEDLRRELHKSGLGGAELLDRPFATLSVGQRKRLMLLSLTLDQPNILLLDEPTNHLDLLTMESLEQALLNFRGAILAVSHDSTFVEKIATEVWQL